MRILCVSTPTPYSRPSSLIRSSKTCGQASCSHSSSMHPCSSSAPKLHSHLLEFLLSPLVPCCPSTQFPSSTPSTVDPFLHAGSFISKQFDSHRRSGQARIHSDWNLQFYRIQPRTRVVSWPRCVFACGSTNALGQPNDAQRNCHSL